MKRHIIYVSPPIWTNEGITKTSREYLRLLINDNNNIVWLDQQLPLSFIKKEPDFKKSFNSDIDFTKAIYFLYGYTDHWYKYINKKCFGYNVLEGSKLPLSWINNMNNENINEIYVPSTFCEHMYKKNGIKKNIIVIPHGINSKKYKPTKINRAKIFSNVIGNKKIDNKFIFFGMGAICGLSKRDRKGLDLLIQTFTKQFYNNENVILLLKLNTQYADNLNDKFNIEKYLKQFIMNKCNNIYLIIDDISEETLIKIYNSVDVAVFPHRGEGFGCIPLETIACGIPTITTDSSGTNDFSDKRLRVKVKEQKLAEFDDVSEQRYPYIGSYWDEPDIDNLQKLMVKVYRNYEKEKLIAIKLSSDIRKKYNWNNIYNKYLKKVIHKWKMQ